MCQNHPVFSRKALKQEAAEALINRVLAPSFKIFASLEDQIAIFNASADIILTEEKDSR